MTSIREPFNAISHLLGAIAVLFAAAVLHFRAADLPPSQVPIGHVAIGLFTLCALALYAASTAYHWGSEDRKLLRRFDHAAIYLMIAGGYIPICLLGLPPAVGLPLLAGEFALATIGLFLSLTREKTPTALRLGFYLVMGWAALPLLGTIRSGTSSEVVVWLVAGGLVYSFGAVIYGTRRPKLWPGRFGYHELWHLFVIGGTLCHLMMIGALLDARSIHP